MNLEAQVSRGRDTAQHYLQVLCVQRPSLDAAIRGYTEDLNDAEFVAFVEGFFGVLNAHEEAKSRRVPS